MTEVSVLSMTAVPVFRAHEGTRVFSATGADVVLAVSAAPVTVVEQAAAVERLEVQSYEGQGQGGRQLRLRRPIQGGTTGSDGTSGFNGGGTGTDVDGTLSANGMTSTDSTNGTDSTKQLDPWDLRTSSPPG